MLLGEISLTPKIFPTIEKELKALENADFLALNLHKRFHIINQLLIKLINEAPHNSFLLSAVLDYMDRINQKKY